MIPVTIVFPVMTTMELLLHFGKHTIDITTKMVNHGGKDVAGNHNLHKEHSTEDQDTREQDLIKHNLD